MTVFKDYQNIKNQQHLPLTAKKFIPLSVATAFAINVLEQPGGPYNNTPFGGPAEDLKSIQIIKKNMIK